ncbi:MAG: hypothetical protein ABTQ27_11220 [Amaricoccus sp.]|uniref:hypothetical protein n=1 Tax=Amaricoccus sp. TaxID=1872485 RepID=UPI0033159F31
MPTMTITEPAARPAPTLAAAAPPRKPEPCPHRATCKSPICKRAWAFDPAAEPTEH